MSGINQRRRLAGMVGPALPGDSDISGAAFNRSAFPLEILAGGKDLKKRQRFPIRALAWIFPVLWKFPE